MYVFGLLVYIYVIEVFCGFFLNCWSNTHKHYAFLQFQYSINLSKMCVLILYLERKYLFSHTECFSGFSNIHPSNTIWSKTKKVTVSQIWWIRLLRLTLVSCLSKESVTIIVKCMENPFSAHKSSRLVVFIIGRLTLWNEFMVSITLIFDWLWRGSFLERHSLVCWTVSTSYL